MNSTFDKPDKQLIRFDWALKRLLRNKADYVVLEGLLSVLLDEKITIVSIKESEANQEHRDDKYNRVDMLVEDSCANLLIIELQINNQLNYFLRMLYGVSKAITEHINLGDSYDKVRKVYHINIVYFELGQGNDYVYHGGTEFRGVHSGELLQLTHKQKEYFQYRKTKVMDLFPEYFLLCVEQFDVVAKNSLDQWMYYLKNDAIPDHFDAPGLPEARKLLLLDSLTKKEKLEYEHHIVQMRHELTELESAHFSGRYEGRAEGRAEGLAEGQAERDRIEAEKEASQKKADELSAQLEAEKAEKAAAQKRADELVARIAELERKNI